MSSSFLWLGSPSVSMWMQRAIFQNQIDARWSEGILYHWTQWTSTLSTCNRSNVPMQPSTKHDFPCRTQELFVLGRTMCSPTPSVVDNWTLPGRTWNESIWFYQQCHESLYDDAIQRSSFYFSFQGEVHHNSNLASA